MLKQQKPNLEIVYKLISELKPYENNPRRHSKKQIGQIAQSIVHFGFVNPIIVSGDGTIAAGHGRYLAALMLGITEVPTVLLCNATDDRFNWALSTAPKGTSIVVYKIDRLTRSLMDFSKLVELFDQHQVTFVSVTQSFNTTTSMGRLTLNVLLSFAQFEREVTGERIRDKIAASRKKGMWMGGNVPLGYDLKKRALTINPTEAAFVKKIFQTYLRLGSVIQLKELLDREGCKTKGGNKFTRGMLYYLLANPLYIGKVKHKNHVYAGEHQAIITQEQWEIVQKKLADNAAMPRGKKKPFQPHLLQGVLFSEQGVVYSPVFTTKGGQRYRYYVSQNKIQKRENPESSSVRIPAQEIEAFVERAIRQNIEDPRTLSKILAMDHDLESGTVRGLAARISGLCIEKIIKQSVHRILVFKDEIDIQIRPPGLAALLQAEHGARIKSNFLKDIHKISVPFHVGRSWKGAVIIKPPAKGSPEDIFDLPAHELRDFIRGVIWRDEHFNGMTIREIAKRDKRSDAFVGGMIRKTLETA